MLPKRRENKGLSSFGPFGLVVAFIVVGLAAIGAVVALLAHNNPDAPSPQSGSKAPQVRQLDRESLRSGGRDPGP